jgi:hypothetical protein
MLQKLRLWTFGRTIAGDEFPDIDIARFGSLPNLRFLTASNVPSCWITYLLPPLHRLPPSPFRRRESGTLPNAPGCFSRVPEVRVLKLTKFPPQDVSSTLRPPVHPAKLTMLTLSHVAHPSRILCQISAPSLQTLFIRHSGGIYHPLSYLATDHAPDFAPLSIFFSRWSRVDFLPLRLGTLELVECLQIGDVAYLIRWLARLPSLVRLVLLGDAIGLAAQL